jgi:hypothetical protein
MFQDYLLYHMKHKSGDEVVYNGRTYVIWASDSAEGAGSNYIRYSIIPKSEYDNLEPEVHIPDRLSIIHNILESEIYSAN